MWYNQDSLSGHSHDFALLHAQNISFHTKQLLHMVAPLCRVSQWPKEVLCICRARSFTSRATGGCLRVNCGVTSLFVTSSSLSASVTNKRLIRYGEWKEINTKLANKLILLTGRHESAASQYSHFTRSCEVPLNRVGTLEVVCLYKWTLYTSTIQKIRLFGKVAPQSTCRIQPS